jgi:hypothetical protein
MFTLTRRHLSGSPRSKTGTTEEDVRLLVDKAAQAARINEILGRVRVRHIDGRLTCIASAATRADGAEQSTTRLARLGQ